MKVKIWDGMVRLFHWGAVALVPLCWYTAEQGMMEWHMTAAYLLASLLTVRILWGFIGTTTARFSHFVRSPAAVIHYLKKWRNERKPYFGHNPAGGYMVLMMLLLLAAQITTGLFASDDIFVEGPLYAYVSGETSGLLTTLHHQLFDGILICVALHLLAIVSYRFKGVNLVEAMITGYGMTAQGRRSNAVPPICWLVPLVIALAASVYWLILPLW
ncbi:cytochrome b/b6 domain-containing protein [Ferrimonas aestuarii]|uniref:Cytochrome B n=1 Tax=Ferrimonas aestuarii TaxID=2569539 RepID=A0A4U1BNL9_9GAMM|nr:cytochrome b/b6 domain-containing protein [Ferrimonas aestuarii]TKB55326.1 cytochrome B [Ferrimonas aestuarii]